MFDLLEIFDSLQTPTDSIKQSTRFSAQSIPGYERHRIGKDIQGNPSLLVYVLDSPNRAHPAPIVLEYLTVQHNLDCRISHLDGTSESDQFTIIRCTGTDSTLRNYFLRVVGAVVTLLGNSPSRMDVSHAIDKLIELFQAMTEPAQKSVQGLWAELFLIARAYDPSLLVTAWHVTPEDRYDFSMANQRIEVKSTANRVRQHHFSLEQLCPPIETNVLIASMYIERAGGGTSVMELAEQVRTRVSDKPDFLLHIDRIISLTLGEKWRDALEARFDVELAEASLAFFEVDAIPTVGRNLPPGVSNVQFKSDLTNCAPVSIQNFQTLGGLFQAALHRTTSSAKGNRRNS